MKRQSNKPVNPYKYALLAVISLLAYNWTTSTLIEVGRAQSRAERVYKARWRSSAQADSNKLRVSNNRMIHPARRILRKGKDIINRF